MCDDTRMGDLWATNLGDLRLLRALIKKFSNQDRFDGLSLTFHLPVSLAAARFEFGR